MKRPRWRTRMAVGAFVAIAGAGGFAHPASAHPLGNLSVNHYHGLVVRPDRLVDDAVVDSAEIPTTQASGAVDADGDGTATSQELVAYADRQCRALQSATSASIGDRAATFSVTSASFAYHPGQAGLVTSRLECRLEAAVPIAADDTVTFSDTYLADRIGWREITATADGLALASSSVPSESVTGRLVQYPTDLLGSPFDVRTATLRMAPLGAASAAPATTAAPHGLSIEAMGPFGTFVDRVNRSFNDLVGRRELTLGVGSLAVALALLLGASHALLPGHGKTVMAAYIAGRQGSVRDAVLVGGTVTATHTGGVLLLGLALSASATLAGEVVLAWLGVASGVLIAVLGLGLLRNARRHRTWAWAGGHGHSHDHGDHGHEHGDHGHEHGDHELGDHGHGDHDGHGHDDPGHGRHAHDGPLAAVAASAAQPASVATLAHDDRPTSPMPGHRPHVSRRGLVGMGVAGGLVPSPSALVVLLSAIALGRTLFGVVLVLVYGIGMAGTLTLAGVLLVRVRDRLQQRDRSAGRARRLVRSWSRAAPYATAGLVVVVGLGLAVRSLRLV